MTAGYSKKSLAQKLGIKEGFKVFIVNSPRDYLRALEVPRGVMLVKKATGPLEFIHLFTKSRKEVETEFPILKQQLLKNGMLWVSWPKGSSNVETDLNENVVREVGLKNGLVDVKVCAVDEIWSGLKFVYRKTDRQQ